MRIEHKNKTGRRKIVIAALLYASLAIRVIIPIGYMPGNALAGEFLVLCPQGVPKDFAASLHHGHSSDDDHVLDIGSACPIGQGLNYDALPNSDVELSAAPAIIEKAFDSLLAFHSPSFERRYASRAPPLV